MAHLYEKQAESYCSKREARTIDSVKLDMCSYTVSFFFLLEEPLNDNIVSDDEEEEEDEEVSHEGPLKPFREILHPLDRNYSYQ